MEDLYDPEEKILCPYNSAHHIRRCRMTVHLVKCKKNYPNNNMVPCDFNTTHMVPEPELQYHHQICCDRKKIEEQILNYSSRTETEPKYPTPNIVVECEENWDDLNYPTYDPSKYLEKAPVLRQLHVESSAKRKNFRLNERVRHNELSQQQQNLENVAREPECRTVTLPPHRSVTNIQGEKLNQNLLKDKLKSGGNKLFLPPGKN